MRCTIFAFSFACLLAAPAVCRAQDPQSPSDYELQQRYDEMLLWLDAYQAWEEWILKWGNKVAFNAAGGIIKERPVRPEPPEWLWDDCRTVLAADGKLQEACRILARWENISHLMLRQKQTGGLTRTDVQPKSSFLRRIHLSAGWVPAQLPAPQVYLAVGMHVGIVEVGRATLPNIGVGLMAVADGHGGTDWKPATVIGIGYRLASFAFPWVNREANLHINVARATIHGVSNMPVGFDPAQNLVGLSLTFAKR